MIEVEKIINFGNIYYFKVGTNILHREDGPAVEHKNGNKYWFTNGICHREAGPAIECANGEKRYFLNGTSYNNIKSDEEWIIKQLLE